MDIRLLVDKGALFGPYVFLQGEWWRLFTAMFLHGGM
ncbi:MAG: rhomboid family intramembrane serine protease, partial [Sulfurovum sp.]|nr:rhomboid family intramembrane serine protease [Sulfurovum sp.]